MAINFGLAGNGFNALESLQAYGWAADRASAQRKTAREEEIAARTLAGRQQAAGQLAQKDYEGATQTALQAGDFDLVKHIGGLQDDHRKQLATEAEHIAGLAYSLQGVPVEQRRAIALQTAQRFGISPDQIPANLDDTALKGIYGWATNIKDQVAASLGQARVADVAADNARSDRLAGNTIASTQERLRLARNADARGAQARSEGRVRFNERGKDRAAIAAGGRFVPDDIEDLSYLD